MKRLHRILGLGSFFAAALALGALSACSHKEAAKADDGMHAAVDSSATSAQDLETVYFDFDEAKLTKATREELKKNAEWLKSHPGSTIQVEGHCDERGTPEYNLALGERRAQAAKSFLIKLGIETGRITTISYGSERPADSGHDESAWSKNRRAVSVILGAGSHASND